MGTSRGKAGGVTQCSKALWIASEGSGEGSAGAEEPMVKGRGVVKCCCWFPSGFARVVEP